MISNPSSRRASHNKIPVGRGVRATEVAAAKSRNSTVERSEQLAGDQADTGDGGHRGVGDDVGGARRGHGRGGGEGSEGEGVRGPGRWRGAGVFRLREEKLPRAVGAAVQVDAVN